MAWGTDYGIGTASRRKPLPIKKSSPSLDYGPMPWNNPRSVPSAPSSTPQPSGSSYPSWLNSLTDEQILSMASQNAQNALDAMNAPIVNARAQRATQGLAQRQELAALGAALAQMRAGIGPQIGADWATAAGNARAIGGGLGEGAKQGIEDANAANQAYIDQVARGSGPSGEAPDAASAEAVLSGMGEISGDAMEDQGAPGRAYGAALPGVDAAATNEDYRASMAQAEQADHEFVNQMIAVAAQYPQLRNQAIDALYNHEMDKLNARMSIDKVAADKTQQDFNNDIATRTLTNQEKQTAWENAQLTGKTAAEKTQQAFDNAQKIADSKRQDAALDLSRQSLNLDVSKQNWAQKMDVENVKLAYAKEGADINAAIAKGQRPSAANSKVYGYVVDQNGNPILNASGGTIKVVKTTATKQTSYQKAVSDARTLRGAAQEAPPEWGADGIYLAAPGAKGAGVFAATAGVPAATTNDPKKAAYDTSMTFNEAIKYIMDLRGISRDAARKALIASGWKPPAATGGKKQQTGPAGISG